MHNNDPDLEKYIAGEILDYYGEETVNDAKADVPPSNDNPPNKRGTHRADNIRTALSVFCAVMFLVGSLVLALSIMNFTVALRQTHDDGTVSVNSGTTSQDGDTFEGAVAGNSSGSDDDTVTSAEDGTDDTYSDSCEDSDAVSCNSSSTRTSSNTVSDDNNAVSDKTKSAGENTTSEQDNSLTVDTDFSSDISSFGTGREYVLSSSPYDSAVSVETIDNPIGENGTVVTGNALYVGLGLALMVLSLAVTLVLHKQRQNEDY